MGQKIVSKLGSASDPKGPIKCTLGVLFLVVGFTIVVGADKTFEASLLNMGVFDVTKIEQVLLQKNTPATEPMPQGIQSANINGGTRENENQSSTTGTAETSVKTASYLSLDQKKSKI